MSVPDTCHKLQESYDLPFYTSLFYDCLSRDCNCTNINILLNIHTEGVSNLFRKLLGQNENLLFEISEKWEDKAGIVLYSHDISYSFTFHDRILGDMYLEYIHFRTVHREFFMNNILFEIGIKNSFYVV